MLLIRYTNDSWYFFHLQQELREAEEFQSRLAAGEYSKCEPGVHRAKIKQSSYFSDEEELSDD